MYNVSRTTGGRLMKGIATIMAAVACVALATPALAAEKEPSTFVESEFRLTPAKDQVTEGARAENAVSPTTKHRDPSWEEIKKLEIVYQVLNAIDAVETIHCLSMTNCHEGNPLLGKHPSVLKLIAIKGGGGVLHYVMMRRTFARSPRAARLAEYISIGFQGAVVGANMRIFF